MSGMFFHIQQKPVLLYLSNIEIWRKNKGLTGKWEVEQREETLENYEQYPLLFAVDASYCQ